MKPSTSSECLPSAQFIKIQSTTGQQIQLFDVQVYSPGKETKLPDITASKSLPSNVEPTNSYTDMVDTEGQTSSSPTNRPTLVPTESLLKTTATHTTSPTTERPALVSTESFVMTTSEATTTPYTCQGITPINTPNKSQPKYLIWYPRAGMGNVLVSYVSAVMYSCLTGRILKIAPYASRERDIFNCAEYFNDSIDGSICQDLEMDQALTRKYQEARVLVKRPEAWALEHCPMFKQHLQYFLCDDGLSDEEFIAVSSCQYWGDTLYSNPYFKDKLPSSAFSEVVRGKLAPSKAVQEKMVQDGPYEVCVHVRWEIDKTNKDLGNDWVNNLGTCVRNILSRQKDGTLAKKEVMLFTMHEDVRNAIKNALETGDEQYPVHFASEVKPDGGLGLSTDKYAGIADMFSMGQQCVNLLASRKASTYLMVGANLMNNIRVFSGSSWQDGCNLGAELTELNPIGDFWNEEPGQGGGSGDVCKLLDYQCPVELSPSAAKPMPAVDVEQRQEALNLESTPENYEQHDNSHQDDKCKRMFEWSMMDRWQSDGEGFDFNSLPQTKQLSIQRMGGPSAFGTLQMSITVRNSQLNVLAVDLTVKINDLKSHNVWHRHTALYGTWVGVQIAQRKYNLTTKRVVYVHDCNNGDLPIEWRSFGEQSCDRGLINQADVVLKPPVDGLMWDLAWDFDFKCFDSEMFKAYTSMYTDKTTKLEPTEAMGCWISRQNASKRKVANLDAVLDMMREVFPRVEVKVFTTDKTASETAEMLQECRVLFGVHGAGHTNAIYARPGVGVVEAIGRIKPAYYRNINMLMDQDYQSIIGDKMKNIEDTDWVIDLEEAKAALLKARDHAANWIQEHGHWRL